MLQKTETNLEKLQLKMYQTLLLKEGLEPLLDIAYSYLGNPICIVDYANRLLDFRQEGETALPQWKTLIDSGQFSLSFVDEQFHKEYSRAIKSPELREYTYEDGKYRSFLRSIIADGKYMGSISLFELNRPVNEQDKKILKTLADILSVKMLSSGGYATSTHLHSQLMLELLTGQIKNPFDLAFRMKTCNWESTPYCLAVLLRPLQPDDEDLVTTIRKSFYAFYPTMKTIVYDGDILVLIEGEKLEGLFVDFAVFCKSYHLYQGVSEPFFSLLELPAAYAQAQKALSLGQKKHPSRLTFLYRDYVLEDMAACLCGSLQPHLVYHSAAVGLAAYDIENNTDFSETFYTYIEQNRSVTKTSKLLNLHKNTVNYRIRRIEEMFHVNLDDFRELAHIYLTHLMMKEKADT